MKTVVICTLMLITFFQNTYGQKQSVDSTSLDYFIGRWQNKSVNQTSNEISYGESDFYWGVGERWLIWSFKMYGHKDTLEVLTFIRYNAAMNAFVFYSFNPFDEVPIPHHGNWTEANQLRIETDFQGKKVRIDFTIVDENEFYQEHFKVNDNSERIKTWKTYYTRISGHRY